MRQANDSRPSSCTPTHDSLSRRLFLSRLGVSAVGLSALSSGAVGSSPAGKRAARHNDGEENDGEELDEALEMLAPYGPSYRGGLSNHGPMAAEALMALGRADAVIAWVDRYRKRLEKAPKHAGRIAADSWREALGKRAQGPAWHAWFANEMADRPWRDVVSIWVPHLAPGMAAAGLHGVIRAGHAVCSLTAKDTPGRRDELARALGYWAADYLPLPGKRSDPARKVDSYAPADALAKVQLLPTAQRRTRGLITSELGDLTGFEPFAKTVDLANPEQGDPDFLAELLGAFAGTFVRTRRNTFGFLHAVTATGAVAELLPFVKPEQQHHVLAYTFQATAAIYARYGREGLLAALEAPQTKPDAKRLVQSAVASRDEHTIKLMATCERGYRRHPDQRLLAAAQKRIGR